MGRPPSQDPLRRHDRRRRKDPRQYRGRPLRPHRRGLGGDQSGAEQRHRGRRSGQGDRAGRLPGAGAHHGSDLSRRDLTGQDNVVVAIVVSAAACYAALIGGTQWTFKKSESSTLISRSCSATRASAWCRSRARTISPRSISARKGWAISTSTMKTTIAPIISVWKSIWDR